MANNQGLLQRLRLVATHKSAGMSHPQLDSKQTLMDGHGEVLKKWRATYRSMNADADAIMLLVMGVKNKCR